MSDRETALSPPSIFPVSVLMERRNVSGNPWISESWNALGVVVGADRAGEAGNPIRVVDGVDADRFLWTGLTVELFRDETESYYHNLMVGTPAVM